MQSEATLALSGRRWTGLDALGRLNGGAEGDRTLDLRIANATLSQLSYRPTTRAAILAMAIRLVQWSFQLIRRRTLARPNLGMLTT